ncbi:hypothetical protein G4G28_14535 [Massilia sp. Dwa41.01b]|uniref:type IV pilus modification PilV family protein n=1 Tax=Massilia sp. Dwa41.01b TaxID=2709302 RepID=UPI001603A8C2|nr:hypothetical protein [Massilia sp. Dwa41.01b]QNA89386.1 hypothetical protein G4G28_14535 [Massilia sp. Dwa41.01b]
MKKMPSLSMRRQGGVALLEALMAAVLLAIGLLGTVGLQARSYAALSEASMRAEATLAAETLMGTMATNKEALSGYAYSGGTPSSQLAPWYQATRTAIPGATIAITVGEGPINEPREVTITIGWQRQATAPANRHVIRAYI